MKEELVPKGVEPICGWQWVYQHLHDLDNWKPSIEIIRPGSRYTIQAKSAKVINEAIKTIIKL